MNSSNRTRNRPSRILAGFDQTSIQVEFVDHSHTSYYNLVDFLFVLNIALGIFVANCILLYIIAFKLKKQKQFSNILFLTLTLSDLLVGGLTLPCEAIDSINAEFFHSQTWLQVTAYTASYAQPTISLYAVLALTLHRLNLMKRPHRACEKMSWKKNLIVVSIWLVPYATWCGFFLQSLLNGSDENLDDWSETEEFYFKFGLNVLSFFLPSTIILPSAVLIIVQLRKKLHSVQPRPASGAKSSEKLDKKPAKSIFSRKESRAILCQFLITFTVFLTQIFYIVYIPFKAFGFINSPALQTVTIRFSYLNSLVDPLILLVFHESIRVEAIAMAQSVRAALSSLI